ncbi:MAG: DUF2505 domain-containing protein [Mycobacterium sp.]|nr:DUF2505 domain-containing protein [Mycobacterium sp.]MBV9720810.1 DUF2505 domain-containing protein [Mycobacterium sp.]
MPRSFDVSVDSPASVEQILCAFGERRYWAARLTAFDDGTATLNQLTVDADRTVDVGFRVNLLRDRLPAVIVRFAPSELALVHSQTWTRLGDDRVHGEVRVDVSGVPVTAQGQAMLAPAQHGSRLTMSTSVAVNIPVVGGAIERAIARQVAGDITKYHRFTSEWIAENH